MSCAMCSTARPTRKPSAPCSRSCSTDSRKAKAQSIKTYIDAALLVVGDNGPSPEIIAAAIARVWRKNRFPPSISEFLDECEEAKTSATGTRRAVTKMLSLLDNAEDVLIATTDLNEAPASFRSQKGDKFRRAGE